MPSRMEEVRAAIRRLRQADVAGLIRASGERNATEVEGAWSALAGFADESREERERRRNTTLHAVRRMLEAERAGARWPKAGSRGFDECETVQMIVAGPDVHYEVIRTDGELLAVVRVEDDGRLVLEEDPQERRPGMKDETVVRGGVKHEYLSCGRCGGQFSIATTSVDERCSTCDGDLIVVVEFERADTERRDAAPAAGVPARAGAREGEDRCDDCEGRGVQVIPAHMLGGHEQRRECPHCRGTGRRPEPVVPLRLVFSQERDVDPVFLDVGRRSVWLSSWQATVDARVVVGDAIVSFCVSADRCESNVEPLRLTDDDRDYLRRLRAKVDALLGDAA